VTPAGTANVICDESVATGAKKNCDESVATGAKKIYDESVATGAKKFATKAKRQEHRRNKGNNVTSCDIAFVTNILLASDAVKNHTF